MCRNEQGGPPSRQSVTYMLRHALPKGIRRRPAFGRSKLVHESCAIGQQDRDVGVGAGAHGLQLAHVHAGHGLGRRHAALPSCKLRGKLLRRTVATQKRSAVSHPHLRCNGDGARTDDAYSEPCGGTVGFDKSSYCARFGRMQLAFALAALLLRLGYPFRKLQVE